MNMVFVGAECAPWSKTGGLGDVMGSLPKAMQRRGHRVMVVAPRYGMYEDAIDTSVRQMYKYDTQFLVHTLSYASRPLPVQRSGGCMIRMAVSLDLSSTQIQLMSARFLIILIEPQRLMFCVVLTALCYKLSYRISCRKAHWAFLHYSRDIYLQSV